MASIESYTTASVFMEANLWMNIWGTVLCYTHTAYYTPKQNKLMVGMNMFDEL